ncbi:MAG: hypothetical protein RPU64_03760 [Candidatus Sedimenticola sp. (ex Thyasira tokunagai)]
MALRLKTHWHKEGTERSLEEIAGAIAFNSWRIAMDKAITLHGEDFVYSNDVQRLAVISEYLIFEAQIAERMSHGTLDDEERHSLITHLVMKMAAHLEENSSDLLGPGDYQSAFVDLFNQRSAEYSEFGFSKDGPSYPFLRHLGFEIQQLMGGEHENRWVIDQVMDKDAPEVYKQLKRVIRSLFL